MQGANWEYGESKCQNEGNKPYGAAILERVENVLLKGGKKEVGLQFMIIKCGCWISKYCKATGCTVGTFEEHLPYRT